MNINLQELSVIIIAKNAEKTIARCLQSVAPIANEIIVVINDCTDDTRSIAESYGARVIEHEWEGFREQKNFALSQARCEWVLSLDADEALSDRLSNAIKSFICNSTQQYSGAKCARKTFLLNRWITHGDWYPDYTIRLFRKDAGSFVGGRVHECVQVAGRIKCLSGDILHYSCEDFSEFVKRNIGYADLSARDMFERGRSPLFLTAILKSCWKFFRCYVIKLGFLDGAGGFFVAKLQAFTTLYKYIKLRSLYLDK